MAVCKPLWCIFTIFQQVFESDLKKKVRHQSTFLSRGGRVLCWLAKAFKQASFRFQMVNLQFVLAVN